MLAFHLSAMRAQAQSSEHTLQPAYLSSLAGVHLNLVFIERHSQKDPERPGA